MQCQSQRIPGQHTCKPAHQAICDKQKWEKTKKQDKTNYERNWRMKEGNKNTSSADQRQWHHNTYVMLDIIDPSWRTSGFLTPREPRQPNITTSGITRYQSVHVYSFKDPSSPCIKAPSTTSRFSLPCHVLHTITRRVCTLPQGICMSIPSTRCYAAKQGT